MHTRIVAVLAVLALSACAKPPPPGPVGSTMRMSIGDGGPVWPPAGEGCEALVRCCDAMAMLDRTMDLGCQLAAANGGTCAEMQAKTTAMFTEMQKKDTPLPGECAP